jgi:hypothetical protein
MPDAAWRPRHYADLYSEHHGLRSRKWVHYFPVYDRLLFPYLRLGRPLEILEIGVQDGGSLEIWKKYLPPGSRIHGMDINKKCLDLTFSDGVQFYLGNAADAAVTDEVFKDVTFDIILDDGSHISREVVDAFAHLFGKLRPGGIYVVEDLFTSYWRNYGGGLGDPRSSVEFFKSLADITNSQWIAHDQPARGNARGSLRGLRRALRKGRYRAAVSQIGTLWRDSLDRARHRNPPRLRSPLLSDSMQADLARTVAGVGFYPGVCAVWKCAAPHDSEFVVVRTGDAASIISAKNEPAFDVNDPQLRRLLDVLGETVP